MQLHYMSGLVGLKLGIESSVDSGHSGANSGKTLYTLLFSAIPGRPVWLTLELPPILSTLLTPGLTLS